MLDALLGCKAVSRSTIGRATRSARGVGRSMKEADDVRRASEVVGTTQAQIQALESQLQQEISALELGGALQVDKISVAPKKTNVAVQAVALVWVPHWQDASGNRTRA